MKKSKAPKTPSATPVRSLKQIADGFAETFLCNYLKCLRDNATQNLAEDEEEEGADKT